MNKKIGVFLDNVCSQIKCKAVHKDIRTELIEHITELKQEYIKNGVLEDMAIEQAIIQMGNANDIGVELNKQHKPQTEWSLIGLTAIIAIIGGIVMYASSKFDNGNGVDFTRYLVFVLIGIATMVGLYFFDYTKLKKLSIPIYTLSMLFVVFISIFSAPINGAKRWLVIGNFSISTAYAILLFLIAFVGFLEKYRGQGGIGIIKLIGLGGLSIIPIMIMPHLAAILLLMTCYSVIILTGVARNHFGGNKKAHTITLLSFGCGGIALFVFFIFLIKGASYLQRITTFLTRGKSDPIGGGWQQMIADYWL